MSGDYGVFIAAAATLCLRLPSIWLRKRRRPQIVAAIHASAAFDVTPIRFNGRKRDCRKVEAMAIDRGWRKVEDKRFGLLCRTVRFVPASENAAKPEEILRAIDRPIEIEQIELPRLPVRG